MTSSTLVFATGLASLALSGLQGKPVSGGGVTYVDAKTGYSVQMMSGFKREGNLDPMGNVQFSGPVENGQAATIAMLGFGCENETAESIGKAAVKQLEGDAAFKVVSSGPMKVAGVAGFVWQYERKLEAGPTVIQRGFVSVKKGTAAVFMLVVDRAAYPKYEKASTDMINSFKWTK